VRRGSLAHEIHTQTREGHALAWGCRMEERLMVLGNWDVGQSGGGVLGRLELEEK
jgi:hypothetical protein